MKDPESSRFSGEPRPELDQAWHEMLDGTLIRLSEEELLQANNATSVRSKDGGYIGSIGVSHSLHCLVSSSLNNGSNIYFIAGSPFPDFGLRYHGPQNTANSSHQKRIKQYMYPDYYYSDNTTDWEEVHEHMDHCLESLRQELLCSADLNLWTFQWTPHSRVKPANHIPQQHACVDWDSLHSWMQNRAITWDDMVTPPDVSYTESDSTEPKGD